MRSTKIYPLKQGSVQGANITVPPEKRQSLLNRFTIQGEGGYGPYTFNFVDRDKMYAPLVYANSFYQNILGGYTAPQGPGYTTYAYTTSFEGTTYHGLSGILRIGAGNYNSAAIFRDGNVFYTWYGPDSNGQYTLSNASPRGPFLYPWVKDNISKFKDLFMPSSYAHNVCQAVLLSSGELYELDINDRPASPPLILNNVDRILAINQAHNADFIVAKNDNTVWHVALKGNLTDPVTNQSEARQIPGLNASDIAFIQIGDPWNSLYVCFKNDNTKIYRLLTSMTEPRNLSVFQWITGVASTPMNTAPAPAPTLDWFDVKTGDTLSTPADGPTGTAIGTYGKHKPLTGFVPFNLLEPGEYFVDGASNEFHFTWLTNRYVHQFRAYGGHRYGYAPGLGYKKFPLPPGQEPVQMATSTAYSMALQLTDGYYLLSHSGLSHYFGGPVAPGGVPIPELYYIPFQLFEKFTIWDTLVRNLSSGRPDVFGYSSNTLTVRNGLTAVTTFNGDDLKGIEDINGKNTIILPQKTPKLFEGFWYMDLFDNPLNVYRPSPVTDICVEAYGLPWKWSAITQNQTPLDTIYPNRPKTWSAVECGDRYEKRWIRQQTLEPAPPLPKANTICKKDKVIWTISTRNWSVSSVVGEDVTKFPYTLKYTKDGKAPYTVSEKQETEIKISACQSLNCTEVINSLTIYTEQTSMFYVHRDIVRVIEDYIKPLLVQYLTFNGHQTAAKNINNIVQIRPITGKRYFQDLKNTGALPLSANGNTNISFVFIDTPTAYLTNCTNGTKTDAFRFDVSQYRSTLASVNRKEEYKFTIFSVTSGNNLDICPLAKVQLSGVGVNNNPDYPLPYNLSDMDVVQRYRYDIPFKDNSNIASRNNPLATVNYYKNLIIEELKEHGVDLYTLTPSKSTYTFCDSVTATVLPTPVLKIYTPNRFVPVNIPVKFENLLDNPQTLESITIDYDDNIVVTYTGLEKENDFFVTYTTPGYKTLNITIVTQNKSKAVLTYPNIVNVVTYYD